MNWLKTLFKRKTLADAVRASAVNVECNLRSKLVFVSEWGENVLLRGLTLSEWHEYSRMAELLSPAEPDAEAPPVPAVAEPWLAYGSRALYAFVLVTVLRDSRRAPVFAAAGTAQRAQDIAEVAASFTHVHDGLVAQVLELSGVKLGSEEAPSDPVADAGNV